MANTSGNSGTSKPSAFEVSHGHRLGIYSRGRLLLLLITAAIVGLNIAMLVEQMRDAEGSTSISALSSAETEIVHLDEVLTMSARMYAATGDARWKERYLDNVATLDSFIAKARHLSERLLGHDLVAATDNANRILVDLENRSFGLVAAGDREKAGRLLQSREYVNAKAEFSAGMDRLWQNMRSLASARLKNRHLLLRIHIFASITCLLIVIYAVRSGMRPATKRQPVIDPGMPPQRIRDWRSVLWATATLGVFLALTFVTVMAKRQYVNAEHVASFDRLANQAVAELGVRSEIPIYCLKGARGLFSASQAVDQQEFRSYFESSDFREDFIGLVAFGYLERELASASNKSGIDKRLNEATYRYTITSDADRDSYVVKYVEPIENNARDAGIDLGTDPNCGVAIRRAIQTGKPVASSPFKIQHGSESRTVIRYFVPVYADAVPAKSPEQRVGSLKGVLFATVSTNDLLTGFSGSANGLINVEVYDGRQLSNDTLLTDAPSKDEIEPDGIAPTIASLGNQTLLRLQTMDTVGREWSVVVTPTPKLISLMDEATPIEEAIAGALISVMLAVFVFLQRTGKSRAMSLARQMTLEFSAAKDHAENALREIEALRSTMDLASLVSVTDTSGTIIEANDKFCEVSGFERDELIGQNHRIVNSGYHSKQFWEHIWGEIKAGRAWHGEVCNRSKDGQLYWEESTIAPFRGKDGQVQKYVSIRNDITERKKAEEQLRLTAQTDKLTSMPNRAMFNHRLDATVRRSQHDPEYHFAVLFIDFDRFKLINDSYGHETGDLLLMQIAARLNSVLRPSDAMIQNSSSLAARFGGDEFVILLDHLTSPDDATIVADRLLEVLKKPYDLDGNVVYSSASIGIVTSAIASGNSEAILRDADVAMYEAKAAGRSRYVVFDRSMLERIRDRHDMENQLRSAIDGGDLHLVYQPIIDVVSGRLVSFEALVRWSHPTLGLIPPDKFIAMAEENGLIVPLGWFVMEQACQTLVRLRNMPGGSNVSMNINVSRRQIMEPEFIAALLALIEKLALPPSALRLEITESLVMAAEESIAESLATLKNSGVQIYMDDFGTGLSSLGLLRTLPLDGIKVDRCFIETANSDRESIAILHAIVDLGHNLGMSVTAEGIEKSEQVATILALECDMAQGYLLGRPVPLQEAEKLIGQKWLEFAQYANAT